jgi:hypothetical protein
VLLQNCRNRKGSDLLYRNLTFAGDFYTVSTVNQKATIFKETDFFHIPRGAGLDASQRKCNSMHRFKPVIIIGIFAGLTLAADSCKDCTCKNYAPESTEATYCRYYREAVWDYVEQSTDAELQKTQLTRLESLYKTVKDCEDMDCIFNEVQADSIAPGFAGILDSANAEAEEEVTTAEFKPAKAGKVLLCGLMNGIFDWRDSLGVEEE